MESAERSRPMLALTGAEELLSPPYSPQGRALELTSLEENQLRALLQDCIDTEDTARNRETALTEYIARLNSIQPLQLLQLLCAMPGGHMAMPLEAISGSNAAPVPVSDDFQAIKCLELQNAIAQRAAERRKRKRAKEYGRELESLLLLKTPRIRDSLSPPLSPEDDFPPATFLSPRSTVDESGEHWLGLDLNTEPQIPWDPKQEQEEPLRLVAKMILDVEKIDLELSRRYQYYQFVSFIAFSVYSVLNNRTRNYDGASAPERYK